MDKDEVINQIKNIVPILKECLDLDYLILFGSYKNGTNTESSDIDLGIVANNLSKEILNKNISKALLQIHKINFRFEPHFFRTEKWENAQEDSFEYAVKKNSQVVYVKK